MANRQRYKDLPRSYKSTLKTIARLSEPISPLDAGRRFTGPTIKRLVEEGHLNSAFFRGRECLIISPLTAEQMQGIHKWTDEDDQELRKRWARGEDSYKIGTALGRQPGMILGRAHRINARRSGITEREFITCVMSWRVNRLRAELIEAERRGLDLSDDGHGLKSHRALQRRFYTARLLVAFPYDRELTKWPRADQSCLRGMRDAGRSIALMASVLRRSEQDVAFRLLIEGRFINGHWTEHDDAQIMREAAQGKRPRDIALKMPNRTAYDVRMRIRQLERAARKGSAWAEGEYLMLLEGRVQCLKGPHLYARLPGRTVFAIKSKMKELFSYTREGKDWEFGEMNICSRAAARDESLEDVAKWLGRDVESISGIYEHAKSKGRGRPFLLSRSQAIKAKRMKDKNKTSQEIARHFGVTHSTVRRSIKALEDGNPSLIR